MATISKGLVHNIPTRNAWPPAQGGAQHQHQHTREKDVLYILAIRLPFTHNSSALIQTSIRYFEFYLIYTAAPASGWTCDSCDQVGRPYLTPSTMDHSPSPTRRMLVVIISLSHSTSNFIDVKHLLVFRNRLLIPKKTDFRLQKHEYNNRIH